MRVTILSDIATRVQMLRDIADDEGWTVSNNNELRVLYKHPRSELIGHAHRTFATRQPENPILEREGLAAVCIISATLQ